MDKVIIEFTGGESAIYTVDEVVSVSGAIMLKAEGGVNTVIPLHTLKCVTIKGKDPDNTDTNVKKPVSDIIGDQPEPLAGNYWKYNPTESGIEMWTRGRFGILELAPNDFRVRVYQDESLSGGFENIHEVYANFEDARTAVMNYAIAAAASKEKTMSKTKGQYRVGIDFNPSGNPLIDEIKAKAAELIDLIETITPPKDGTPFTDDEVHRLKAKAQTDVEGAAMWAVEAVIKRPV